MFVSGACFLCFAQPVKAFEVRPAIQELSVEAGSSTERILFVKNTEKRPLDLFLRAQTFVAGTGGVPRFLDPSETQGFPEWVRASVAEFRLLPGEERAIRIRIHPPKEASRGGAYGGVFVAEKPAIHGAMDVSRRIATLWFVTVTGEGVLAKPEFQMHAVWGERNSWLDRFREVGVQVKNTGIIHGTVRLKTSFDGEREVRLLPNETRIEYFVWKEGFFLPWHRATIEIFLAGDVHPQQILVRNVIDWWIVMGYLAIGGMIASVFLWKRRVRRRQMV